MKSELFRQLFESKFGTERGSQLRGANALNIRQGNLSAYLRGGNTAVPQKYADALLALPDYVKPSGISHEMADGVHQLVTYFTVKLTPISTKHIDFLSRFATNGHHAPDLAADEDTTAKWFELMLGDLQEALRIAQAPTCARVDAAIARDKEDASRQLTLELNDRKHLVADELTENEINADEDPLS
jgi:hypothetical protein